MAVLAAVMLQNLDDDDDNSSTSSRGSRGGSSVGSGISSSSSSSSSGGGSSDSGGSNGSIGGSSYDSGVAWTTSTSVGSCTYGGTPPSNHGHRRRRKPSTPHRIVCPSPVKSTFLNEAERVNILLQVTGKLLQQTKNQLNTLRGEEPLHLPVDCLVENSNVSRKSQRNFIVPSSHASNKDHGLLGYAGEGAGSGGTMVVQAAKKTRRRLNSGSSSNGCQKGGSAAATTAKTTSFKTTSITSKKMVSSSSSSSLSSSSSSSLLAFESQQNKLNYYFHISKNQRKNDELLEHGDEQQLHSGHRHYHDHHHHHHHHNPHSYRYHQHSSAIHSPIVQPKHRHEPETHYNNNTHVYQYHYEITKNDTTNATNHNSFFNLSSNLEQTTKDKTQQQHQQQQQQQPQQQQQQHFGLETINAATKSFSSTTSSSCTSSSSFFIKSPLCPSSTVNGIKGGTTSKQNTSNNSNNGTNNKSQTHRSKYLVKNANGTGNTGGNHAISEYFPVRRSVRKTKTAMKEEMARNLECAILEERCDGLKVAYFEGKGRGVVAERRFERGEFVIEYVGDLISIAEAAEREKRYALDESAGCYMYYFKHQNQQYCIDATEDTGKLGRLVNHSRYGNLMTKVVVVKQVPHLVLIAKDNIEIGDEICYDYGDRSKESLIHHPWLAF